MFDPTVGRLRAVALVEGISFLILLGVAMPLKYFAGMPQAVTFAGWEPANGCWKRTASIPID